MSSQHSNRSKRDISQSNSEAPSKELDPDTKSYGVEYLSPREDIKLADLWNRLHSIEESRKSRKEGSIQVIDGHIYLEITEDEVKREFIEKDYRESWVLKYLEDEYGLEGPKEDER